MKKYISLTLLAAVFSVVVKAQNNGKDSLLSVIAKDVCADVSKQDLSKATKQELNTKVGLVILASVSAHNDALKKYYGNGTSEQLLEEMGTDLGVKLATECPAFVKLLSENKQFLQDDESEDANATKTVSGTLQKIVFGDFTYLQVKDPNGKLMKIWWMEPFDGAETLATDKLLNKPVVVSYTVRTAYNAQQKEYSEINVATKIQVIQ